MKQLTKNTNNGLIYITNRAFSTTKNTAFDNRIIASWCFENNIDKDTIDFDPDHMYMYLINAKRLHRITADDFIKDRRIYLNDHSENFILINSLYDIHPNIKKALHFIDKLCHPQKFKLKDYNIHLYVLSLDPNREITEYLEGSEKNWSLMQHHRLASLVTPRERYSHNRLFLDYLAGFRLGDVPVSYPELSKVSGIKMETIKSHIKRHFEDRVVKTPPGRAPTRNPSRKLTEDERKEIIIKKEELLDSVSVQ